MRLVMIEAKFMATETQGKTITRTVQLADRLVADIQHRKLRPGDIYLTTLEAARYLGVAGASANRALQLLEKLQIIRRSQGLASVILEPPKLDSKDFTRINFLVPEIGLRTEGIRHDGFLFGLQEEFPAASVSLHLLPQGGYVERLESLIHQAMTSNGVDAFVLWSVPFEIQKAIAQTKFPAAVYGTAYPGIENLPCLDSDYWDSVTKLVGHLRERGAKRIATLLRQFILGGGNQLIFNAILSILGNSAPICFLVSDHDLMVAAIRNILRDEPSVDAFLCLTTIQAEAVVDALKALGRPIESVEIAVLFEHTKRGTPPMFTHLKSVLTSEEIGRTLALMLREPYCGNSPKNEVIPTELVVV